jgi:hypothetical protein
LPQASLGLNGSFSEFYPALATSSVSNCVLLKLQGGSTQMQELKPFATLGPLKKALDNGGRFYNFFAAAEDEVVTRGELAKAAGVFTASAKAFLFLEMVKQDLTEQDQHAALKLLEPKLRHDFEKKRPARVLPSLVDKEQRAGTAAIVTGFVREIGAESQFVGFVIVPIMIGKVMVPMMIPIQNLYRVLELFDDEQRKTPSAIVCTPLKKPIGLSGRMQFGGILKTLKNKTKAPPSHPLFLEAAFWANR